jgi:hypothetical protein
MSDDKIRAPERSQVADENGDEVRYLTESNLVVRLKRKASPRANSARWQRLPKARRGRSETECAKIASGTPGIAFCRRAARTVFQRPSVAIESL